MRKLILFFLVLLLIVAVGCNNEPRGEVFIGEWVSTESSDSILAIERTGTKSFLVKDLYWDTEHTAIYEEEGLLMIDLRVGPGDPAEYPLFYIEESDQIKVDFRKFNRKK